MSKKTGSKGELRLFGKDIKQWIDLRITEDRFNGRSVYGKLNSGEDGKASGAPCKKTRQCGICMNDLVVFGIDFSLRCLHAICWCCILRLRFLLKNKECPFCKKTIDCAYITSNSMYFDYVMDGSTGLSSKGESGDGGTGSADFCAALKHPREKDMDDGLFSEKYKVYYESYACKWYLEKVLEYRCWYPNCRPNYTRYLETGCEDEPSYEDIKSLGEHLFQKHRVRCCYVCIEKRETMLLPEHFLFGIKDIKRHMTKGEMRLKPPILPHVSCPVCRVWCLDKEDFSDHVKNEHFSCVICEEREGSLLSERNSRQRSDAEMGLDPDPDHESNNSDSAPKITYVYKDYTSLQLHWKQKHYPCEHENCMFIVFENESELLFHKATCHSTADRRGNITVPIAVTSYRQQQMQRRFADGSAGGSSARSSSFSNHAYTSLPHPTSEGRGSDASIPQLLDVPTPSLYSLDETSNEALSKMCTDNSVLWRAMLISDLSKCIRVVKDDLAIQLGLEDKCRDLNRWNLTATNKLYTSVGTVPKMIRKIGYGYINGEISPRSFIIEAILLIWSNSPNVGKLGNSGVIRDIKREFKTVSTSPNAIKYYFSPVHEPILITVDRDGATGKRIPSQFIDRILVKEADWSVLSSDIASMLLASLILGLPRMQNRRELLDSLVLVRDEIQTQKLYIVPKAKRDGSGGGGASRSRQFAEDFAGGHAPRFKFGSLESQLDLGVEDANIDTAKICSNGREDQQEQKVIDKKYVAFEKLVGPEDIVISSKTTFLESIYAFLSTCWPRIRDKFSSNKDGSRTCVLGEAEKDKIRENFKLLNYSQTATEINALSSLYQHTSGIVTSANTIERVLGLRAPYYRLAASSSGCECEKAGEKQTAGKGEGLGDAARTEATGAAHAIGGDVLLSKQWLGICSKALNKICLYDIEVILVYCESCMETLCDPDFVLKERSREASVGSGEVAAEDAPHAGESSTDLFPRTVNAGSEIVSRRTLSSGVLSGSAAGVSSNSVRLTGSLSTGNGWSRPGVQSCYSNSTPKTVFASKSSAFPSSQNRLPAPPARTTCSSGAKDNPDHSVSSGSASSSELVSERSRDGFPQVLIKTDRSERANAKSKQPENAPKWRCMLCTHVNPGSRNRCLICSTRK
ncbi:protein containing ringfinger [Cryptosporidium ryanae]|uniref:protein containing ringfinger n=1 Tax=Cryptosporidium ryanae TaxID=515981 RepID=UPI00351A1D79|nr:protein containing ringfinger [Cryptosporidium ryanae]